MGKKIVITGFASGILVVLIYCLLLSAGCTSPPANLTATEVAEKFIHQQDTMQDLDAIIVITTEYTPPEDRFRMQKKGQHNYRVEYLNSGSEATGTLVITNGTVIWWYSPLTKTVRTTTHFDPEVTWFSQSDFQKMINNLFVNHPHAYTLDAIDGADNSYVIVFSALPKEPFSELPDEYQNARVWIDADTWIAKRIDFFNAEWPSPMTVKYENIRMNSGIPDSTFVFDPKNVPNPPQEFRHHDPVVFLFSLEGAYNVAGYDLVIPGYVPEGYSYSDGYQMGDGTLSLSLVNGKKQWIGYIDSPVIGKPYGEPFAGESTDVVVNGTSGTFQRGSDKNQLQWIEGGHAYTITGIPDESEMMRMATSLVHVNDTLMKTLPQKGEQVAQPLTEREMVTIVIPQAKYELFSPADKPGIIVVPVAYLDFTNNFTNTTALPTWHEEKSLRPEGAVAMIRMPVTMYDRFLADAKGATLELPESSFVRRYDNLSALYIQVRPGDTTVGGAVPPGGTGMPGVPAGIDTTPGTPPTVIITTPRIY
jgi:outer membrane lipoprotein-sorting protein